MDIDGIPSFDEEAILEGIRRWVMVESPSTDAAGVNRMMDLAAAAMAGLGARIERIAGRDGFADAVLARSPRVGEGPGILVLCHLDTVHPLGTLDGLLPYRREGDKAYGPGIFDMKGGAYIACNALARIVECGLETPLPVSFMFIPDEEVGSPSSRRAIEAEARNHKYVLIPEPARESGDLVTGRWAIARFGLRATGRAAHAGARLGEGRSAIREMALQIPRIEDMSDPDNDITLSVGRIEGGTFVNVVPVECTAEVLAVAPTRHALDDITARMTALEAIDPEVAFRVEAGPVRPLFEPDQAMMSLYRKAAGIARELGFDPGHCSAGGGSDGNFTGAAGILTLDGLGVRGEGFHTPREHLLVSSLVPRSRFLAALFLGLE